MQPFRLRDLVFYFLKLGATGFGGPIALMGYMHHDLVEKKKWFVKEDYLHGVALAQLVPGPVAAQLGIYFGWLKGGVRGATAIALAFLAPPFLIVLALSYLYVIYQGLPWVHGIFYGMSAAVIAVIAQTAFKLAKISWEKKWGMWAIGLGMAALTIALEKVSFFFFIAGGLLGIIFYGLPDKWFGKSPRTFFIMPLEIFLFFAKAAFVVYGSGMAIIPFIYGDLVHHLGWLNEQQFMDAVAVGMITPGPLLITAGFMGYLMKGFSGAAAGAVGVFLPVYLFVIVFAPIYKRLVKNKMVKAFAEGITAAATGAIAGSAWILGRAAIVDFWSAGLALTVLICLLKTKIPVPLLILAGGLAGTFL